MAIVCRTIETEKSSKPGITTAKKKRDTFASNSSAKLATKLTNTLQIREEILNKFIFISGQVVRVLRQSGSQLISRFERERVRSNDRQQTPEKEALAFFV